MDRSFVIDDVLCNAFHQDVEKRFIGECSLPPNGPLAPLGHVWMNSASQVVIEAFVDYCCPYSARLFKRLTTK